MLMSTLVAAVKRARAWLKSQRALRGLHHLLILKRLAISLSTRCRGKNVGPNQLSHQLGVMTTCTGGLLLLSTCAHSAVASEPQLSINCSCNGAMLGTRQSEGT